MLAFFQAEGGARRWTIERDLGFYIERYAHTEKSTWFFMVGKNDAHTFQSFLTGPVNLAGQVGFGRGSVTRYDP